MTPASSPVFLSVLFVIQAVVVRSHWIPPRKRLKENKDYSNEESVGKIHSDYDEGNGNIQYSLEGVGASEYPFHVFTVDPVTGHISLNKILDREDIDTYNLKGVAKYADGTRAEDDVEIIFKVVDENDNVPVFNIIRPGAVDESSAPDTMVMKINVTDADETGNDNSKIRYSLVSQDPSDDMFYISGNGIICVKNSALDREKSDKYILVVKAQDLDGRPGGNAASATVTINIGDVNDNPPTLEKEQYEGSIDENTQGVEVMRLKANDLDLKGTENWEAVFDIQEGNEAGYFSIRTDPKTNEGVLMLDKAVDYEDIKNLNLGVVVKNKAAASGGGGGGDWSKNLKKYPLKINVNNKPEGPAFDPKIKTIALSEGGNTVSINKVIAHYPAIDGDTKKPAENVRYAKGADPDNWLIIDPETAEIKLNKIPDRESKYLKNGTYYANILCISEDAPGKTATGTVAIQVEDLNDHCPTLTSTHQSMCRPADHVFVNAKDEDAYPNGPPFDFKILPEGTEGKWQVERLNDTAVILRAQEEKWTDIYKVMFEVRDEQGQACPEPQMLKIHVCTCEDGVMCGKPNKTSGFGPAGIGLLFLGLLMLLLIPLLLLFCHCGSAAGMPGTFAEMPFDTKSHLINYRTEGQGENTAVPLLNMPTVVDGDRVKLDTGAKTSAMIPMESMGFQQSVASMNGMNGAAYDDGYFREQTWETMNDQRGNGFYSEFQGRGSAAGGGFFDGMALPDHILADYYNQKLASEHNLGVKDALLVFDYEGQGSPAGSVASLSNLGSDNDLQFLDDLGPKFKTLAGLCGGKKMETEVKQVIPPTQTSVSSLMTTQTLPPLPQLQPSLPQPLPAIPKAERTVVRETVKESTVRDGMTTVKEGMVNQGQTLLLQQQQPVYYTTTPVMQPMHYVVQPQVQNTMLLAEAPATNLQGMVLVNGTQTMPAQGMVIQGQPMMSTAQVQGPGVVLVGGGGVHTGIPSGAQTMMVVEGKVPAGSMKVLKGSQPSLVQGATIQPGSLSGSQIVLEGAVPAGSMKVIKGGQTTLVQGGTLQPGGLSGSQRVLVVGGPTSVERQLGGPSAGSKSSVVSSSTTTVKATPAYSKTVVREKFTEL